MALTFGRWVLAAVVGCALAAAIVFRVEPRPPNLQDSRLRDLSRRDDRARNHLRTAAARLRMLEIRDSLLPSLSRSNAPARVVIGAGMPADLREPIGTLVATVDRERGVAPRYPGVIAFVADVEGPGYSAGYMLVDHFLPSTPGAPCVTLVRVNGASPREMKTVLAHDATALRLLGPCAFYEAFGPPGAGIAPWLEAGGWTVAQAGSWQRDIARWDPAGIEHSSILGREDMRSLELRGAVNPEGLRCVAGDEAACGTALINATTGNQSLYRSLVWGSIVSPRLSLRLYNSYYFVAQALGPHQITYLGDMVHAIGAEKFARFWASAESPPAAFRGATGVELDTWTMQWMRRAYGDQHRGPGTKTSSMVAATLIAVIAGLLAMYATTRRQIAA